MARRHYSFPLYTSRGFDLTPDGTFSATGPVLKTLSVTGVAAPAAGGAYYSVSPTDLSSLVLGNAAVPSGCPDAANNGLVNPAFIIQDIDQANNRIKISNTSTVVAGAGGNVSVYAATANGTSDDQRSAMLASFELPSNVSQPKLTDILLTPCGVHNIDLQDTREDVVECFVCNSSASPLGLWLGGTTQTSLNVWRSGVLEQFAAGANLGGVRLANRNGAVPQPDNYPAGAALYVQSAGPRAEYNTATFARWASKLGIISVLPFSGQETRLSSVDFTATGSHILMFLSITGNTDETVIQRAAGRISFNLEY